MKKLFMVVFVAFVFVMLGCVGKNANQNPKDFLCGNWYTHPEAPYATIATYNWGDGKTVSNFTLEIDLQGDNPKVNLPMLGGPFPITEVKNVDKDKISFTFFFDRGGFYVTYLIHKLDKGAIWFEFKEGESETLIPSFSLAGEKFLWYKIAGPEMQRENCN